MRHRLKERFPELQDDDLPLFELKEAELVSRIARRTGLRRTAVRRALYEIGLFVPPRVAVRPLRREISGEVSLGSGVPEDTGQSGTSGLGPSW